MSESTTDVEKHEDTMNVSTVRDHGKLFALVLTGLIVVVLAIFSAGTIKRQLNDWKLLPQSERLTELYFTHPNDLPNLYQPGHAQTVSFTTHNLEYKYVTYHYQILEQAENSSSSKLLKSGSFSLFQNQTTQPSVTITPINLGSRVQISVKLTNINESIDYWVVDRKA